MTWKVSDSYFNIFKKKGHKLICIFFPWNMQDSDTNLYTNDTKEDFVTVHKANSTPYLELAFNQEGVKSRSGESNKITLLKV